MLIRIFFSDGSMNLLRVSRIPVAGDHIAIRTAKYEVTKVTLVAHTSISKSDPTAYVDVK
jgi:hypothetical protein